MAFGFEVDELELRVLEQKIDKFPYRGSFGESPQLAAFDQYFGEFGICVDLLARLLKIARDVRVRNLEKRWTPRCHLEYLLVYIPTGSTNVKGISLAF